ncbi:MAG TPA: glycosyltransferase family 9 protein [Brevundimonas sp.]|jgi:heptosyltransferase-3|uniref:glycosyltransferase family 9 protein n=1 Tax=Brevundimonas sp. TaxID=1871086 RepID=UPI002BE263F1|nr:glycosyltransferase family 9 protein [Brevundimonas sp.]HRH21326.1 glycosyltransferase family 9 protein [Brevundimonas sp.]
MADAPRRPRRSLFITNTRIGDAVLTTGLLNALHQQDPDVLWTVVAGPVAAPLFVETPFVERVIPLRKIRLSLHWALLWTQLVATGWDTVVDLRGSAISRLLPARRRFLRRSVRADHRHKVVQAASVIGQEAAPPAPGLHVAPATRAALQARLPSRPMLALSPSANRLGKTWPLDRYIELMDRLTRSEAPLEGWSVAVLGGADEAPAAARLMTSLPGRDVRDFSGEPLPATAALLEQAALFVGNDSGLMHMAAAVGCPVAALFGPTDERLYGPWTANRRIIRAPAEVVTFGPTSRTVSETESQMLGITVDQAVEAIADLATRLPDRGLRPI